MQKLCQCGCGQVVKRRSDGLQFNFRVGHKIGKVAIVTAPIETVCGFCAKPITVENWRVEKFQNVFCSRECGSLNQTAKALKTYTCQNCQKEFQTVRKKNGKQIFCSLKCFNQLKLNDEDLRPKVNCSYCQKEFRVFPSKLKNNKNFFCNRECRAEFIKGENNPAFKTGEANYGEYGQNWKKQRRAARKRDNSQCVLCRFISQKVRDLHVHHIIEVHKFDGNFKKANDLKNLITLCNPCHTKIHQKLVMIIKE